MMAQWSTAAVFALQLGIITAAQDAGTSTCSLVLSLALLVGCAQGQVSTDTTSCDVAINLATVSSPLTGTTNGATNFETTSCGGEGNEAIFSAVVQPGEQIDIGMDTNDYDSRHETKWGGTCPGTNSIACTDDPDTRRHTWTNDQATAQTVYFTIDAYSNESGSYTLSWRIGAPQPTTGGDGGGGDGGTSDPSSMVRADLLIDVMPCSHFEACRAVKFRALPADMDAGGVRRPPG